MNINFLSVTPPNTHNGYGMCKKYLIKYLEKEGIHLQSEYSNQDITLIFHIPPAIQHAKGRVKILYTMLEGDTVPDSWKPFLSLADKIIVPTRFVQETFKRAGFESSVIPLGYESAIFKEVGRQENHPYTFLHYEAFQDRKGWQDLLDAWFTSLHEEEFDARLLLKTIRPYSEIPEEVKQFVNVKVISGEIPHHALFDIMSEVDAFVFPSRGEGFSIPPLEAMATGLPTILSIGHSHLDYYNEDYMYGVPCEIKIPAKYPNWESQGGFVRCNIDNLAGVLKHVYTNREEARNRGHLAASYVKDRYTFSHTARKLAEFLCQL